MPTGTPIAFTKMHALGNDFMIIDGLRHKVNFDRPYQISSWADRHRGVGFDQLLWVGESASKEADFECRIFNADGSEVGQCGNGMRCLARFIFEQGISVQRSLRLRTKTALIHVTRHQLDWYEVALPTPYFEPKINGEGVFVDVGNPHWVIETSENIHALNISVLGPQLQNIHHVNIEWVNRIQEDHLSIRIFERGAGETQACGSGALASAAAMIHTGSVSLKRIRVDMPGGHVMVSWPDCKGPIFLEGEAYTVYHGLLYA
jgi:diaminopimelate epimerase